MRTSNFSKYGKSNDSNEGGGLNIMQYRTDSFQACYVFYSYIRRLTSSAAAAERRTSSSLLENYAENWARLGPAHTVHGLRPYLESDRPTVSSRATYYMSICEIGAGASHGRTFAARQDARSSRLSSTIFSCRLVCPGRLAYLRQE